MSLRFRKSIKVGKNTKINLSKSGVGVSTGVKGARVSVNQKGVRKTLSVPGTGVSHVSYSSHKKNNTKGETITPEYTNPKNNMPKAKYYPRVLVISFFLLSLTTLLYGPIAFIIVNIFTGYFYFKVKSNENKAYGIYNKSLKQNRNEDKLEMLYEAQSIDPENILVNNALAIMHYNQHQDQQAIDAFERMDLNKLDQVNTDLIYSIYLSSLYNVTNYKKIIEVFEPLIEKDLNVKQAVALSYKNLGQVKKASEILATGPVKKRTYDEIVLSYKYELGLCYLELGQKQKAITQLKKVYEVDSSFKDIIKYAQQLEFAVGEHNIN